MFEHYTFGVPARLEKESSIHDISPHDTSYQPANSSSAPASPNSEPAASSALTDLLFKLEDSQLRSGSDDVALSYLYGIPSPPTDAEDELPLEVDPAFDNNSTPVPPMIPRPSSALRCRRLQRQLNTQLLCTQPQLQSINALVDEMVASGSQCNVHEAPLPPPTPAVSVTASPQFIEADSPSPEPSRDDDFDEGFSEPTDDVEFTTEALMMRLRGSNGPSGVLKYTSSSRMRGPKDVVNKPRMRKRISQRKTD